MARSSRGPRQATTWAAEQNSRPLPRIVRLGRPANDNGRASSFLRALLATVATAIAAYAVYRWLDF